MRDLAHRTDDRREPVSRTYRGAVPVIAHEDDAAPPVEGVDDEAAEERPAALRQEPELAAAQSEEPPAALPTAPAIVPHPRPVRSVPQPQIKVARLEGDAPTPRPRPAFVSGVPRALDRDPTTTGSLGGRRQRIDARLDGSTSRYMGAATATPSTLRHQPQRQRADIVRDKARPFRVASLDSDAPAPTARPVRGGMIIQVGATPTIEQANALIARAKSESRGTLARARPFTEKVQKGSATLYRARFAGLESETAGSVCKNLKRAGIACFAMKN